MPLFISEEEFRRCSDDAALVAEKADEFIRELYTQIETVRAEADAGSITLEQTCSLIEQKYVSLSADYSSLQSQHSEIGSLLERRAAELGQVQSEKQQLLLQSIEKDGEIERLRREASELHKSKRQLMEMLEQKDIEISEKNATVKSYLDKIVDMTENAASKDARLRDLELEMGRLRATADRYLQEKELIERHNRWLNEELTAKIDSLNQLRKTNGELETELSSKLEDVEKKYEECSRSLKLHKGRVKELEENLSSVESELLSTKDAAAAAEEHFSAELSTVTKLVDLYKESSEEWSKKAGDLEGVIKALETHLHQVESEYKDRHEQEVCTRKEAEKESADLKEKLQACKAELEKLKKENDLNHLPLSSFMTGLLTNSVDADQMVEDDRAIIPRIPAGVSGTALAASLLRDGWTLTKMYAKYHEAVDALRHEQLGRKQSQAILERVLYEIEEKAGVIIDEREEHERVLEAYSTIDQKLQDSLSEHSALEITIEELKANLKRQERDNAVAQKEIVDLQTQVAILLKECRDVQLRCGSVAQYNDDKQIVPLNSESNAEDIISERLLTFKDISGLVEQNVQLRSLVRNLSDQVGEKEAELKDKYEKEIQMHTRETASKVNAVLLRAEEQARMIESLHTSVAMYKKLYEEEHKRRSYNAHQQDGVPEQGSREVVMLQESSHDASRKVQEEALERLKNLEEDLAKSRNDIVSLRSERDKLALETQFAQEKLARFMKEFDLQREENRGLTARNDKFSQMIVDYQKKLRESAESVNASNELSRKLTMEVSILKSEKEILQNAEKRASDEVRDLSERLHRLQATLSTIQSAEEVREEARCTDRRKQEEYISKIEREWAEAKKELQEERDNARHLSLERESTLKNALRRVEELSKELADALQSLSAAESRAAVAEARRSDLEKIIESARKKDSDSAAGGPSSSSEKILANFHDEIEKLRVEAQSSKDHMLQYKNIAQVNEEALKQMESVHENFRNETDEVKRSLEAELHSLKQRVNELEDECKLKTEEAISANARKEEALASALSETSRLKDYYSVRMSQIVTMESQISALKEDLGREHQRWRAAQDNYERQVVLQSETIQELTKTSQALASAQEEMSEFRKVVDVLKTENNDLKSKWETEKLAIEVYRSEADKKYSEVNELNKILHSRLEAMHIKLAEEERGVASGNSSTNFGDVGLQNVVNYLRRSKEITETEFSLLKQEKQRLQSQLENATKSLDAAHRSLHTERAKSQASLKTEEEFKSLQLQIREISLLRESNVQLREENRHNFEECQKLREVLQNVRTESENFEKLLSVRDTELESQRKEIDRLKMEKVSLEKRIEELEEKCKGVDIDDYNRLKESYQQMQVNLREKNAELLEIKNLLLEKQDTISILEHDVARSRTEVNERETRINDLLQAEASLKSEVDKFKRLNLMARRKCDGFQKEKEDLSKEVQSLSKQLEDAKQVKAKVLDSAGEQALREKEKEKDTRIQILERTLERHREDLKKAKEDHHKEREKSQKLKKMIVGSREIVTREQKSLLDELNRHKQALRALQDEVDKLKNCGGSQSENTQKFSSTLLEDFVSAYFQAVDNFDQVTQPASNELDSATTDAPPLDSTTSVGAQAGQASTQPPAPPAANVPLTRTSEERERRLALTKANMKMGRKLVRPNITKPKEPQGDVEMSEADDSNTVISSSHYTESQGNATAQTTAIVRKRPSSASFSSDLQEQTLASEDTSTDIPVPLKKSKASESPQEGGEEVPADPIKRSEVVAATEETADDGGNLQQGTSNEETVVDVEKDESETAEDQVEEEPAVDEQIQVETLTDTDEVVADEKLEKPSENVVSDDQLRDQTEEDIQRIVTESDDREEGEMDGDFADNDADVDFQGEQIEPENSPSGEPSIIPSSILETGEIDPSQTPEDEKNGDTSENIIDGSNKVLSDIADPMAETDQSPVSFNATTTEEASGTTPVDVGASEQGGSTPPPDNPVSPLNSSSTTINLQERARQRAHLRQSGMAGSTSSTPTRGRGRLVRGRGVRGGRTPRGQSPG